MKQGKNLQELAVEIKRQQENKRDFLIPTKEIRTYVHNGELELGFPIEKDLFMGKLTPNGHAQLGQFCDIPKKYYDTMLNHPELLAHNTQHWLTQSNDKRLVRSLDGNIRALLSDKYRRLDNYDIAQNILPMLMEAGVDIESSEITDKKLYIKAIAKNTQAEITKGDVVSAGLIISNSEIGHGSLSVKPLIYRLICQNGAIVDDLAMRKYHIGKQNDMMQIEFSNDTVRAEDKAFWLQVRDLVKHTLTETTFETICNNLRDSTTRRIEAPDKAIEMVTKKYSINEAESGNILNHLILGGDLTSWGLGNAVTRMAQDVESYDRSVELETIGYQIMQNTWN